VALTPPENTDIATMQALARLEERLGARIDLTVGASAAALTRSQHYTEVRTIGIIVLAVLGIDLLG
jgi:hypothetical protein